jgi:hypothetical protein
MSTRDGNAAPRQVIHQPHGIQPAFTIFTIATVKR